MKPLIFFKIDTKKIDHLVEKDTFFSDDTLIEKENNFIFFEKKSFFYKKQKTEDLEIFIFGSPIINGKIDFINTINLVENSINKNNHSNIKNINGQFLILCIDRSKSNIVIINDRFNSISLYYYFDKKKKELVCSNLYYYLIKYINKTQNVNFDNIKMLEFLWMNRLMGEENYDQFSKYLLPATILKFENEITLKNYWRPNYTKTNLSQKKIAKKYYTLVKNSVKMMTSDEPKKKYGNFISSGLDSRLLSSFINPQAAGFTVTFSRNLEYETAKEISNIVGCEHIHLLCSNDHFEKIFNDAIELSGGLYNFLDAFFYGFKDEIREKVDVAFNGHALDFLHYGNYLPSYFVKILGSKTFIRKLLNINNDNIAEKYLIHGNYYREKGINILDYIKEEYKLKSYDKLKKNVQKDIDTSADVAKDIYDKWEYLLTHTLGRHYSQINITSMTASVPIRTPAFENELFDLHSKVKPHIKIRDFHRIYALRKANKKVGRIISSNHGFPASTTPVIRTFFLAMRKLLRILTGNQKYMSPTLKDRTIPNLNTYLRNSKYFQQQMDNLLTNKLLQDKFYIIDWKKINILINNWKKGIDTDPIFIFSLLTLHGFFKKIDNEK